MWVFTPIGFFSATKTNPKYADLPLRQQTGHIMVRARVRADLERLIALYVEMGLTQEEGPTIFDLPGHDYPYRTILIPANWTALVARMADDIDYSNFKSAVEARQETPEAGKARHDLYMKVWGVMHSAETWLRTRAAAFRAQAKSQGTLSFWSSPGGRSGAAYNDPRSEDDLRAFDMSDSGRSRGWKEWLEEDEERAVLCDLPEGTHRVVTPAKRRGKTYLDTEDGLREVDDRGGRVTVKAYPSPGRRGKA